MRFSVIIPAFQAQTFIEECLTSIIFQPQFRMADDYEILVGVDGCPATMERLKQIRARYSALRLFWFPENRGPYIVRNTLAYQARGEFLIFFDADDVMFPGLAEWCERNINHRGVVHFTYWRIRGGGRPNLLITKGAAGVFGIRKESFLQVGGFKPWRCAADAEFHPRAERAIGRPVISEAPLFEYRKHPGCLTSQPETAGNSKLRANYHAITRREYAARPFVTRVNPVFSDFEEEMA
jgi:glycosyltransferase involved in cell wall biosynthesis